MRGPGVSRGTNVSYFVLCLLYDVNCYFSGYGDSKAFGGLRTRTKDKISAEKQVRCGFNDGRETTAVSHITIKILGAC